MSIRETFRRLVYPSRNDLGKPFLGRRTVFLCLLYLPILSGCAKKPSFSINLQNYPLYLKAGFDLADTAAPQVSGEEWRVFRRWTHVLISKLNLPGNPKRTFLSPFGKPPQEWTFLISFRVEGQTPLFPGLFLAAIGENWEIYLNGTIIQREMHLDESGAIRERHSQRKVFFPIDRKLLWPGENLLVFRIVGDPTDQTVGFQYAGPYYLGDYEYIARENSEILEFILVGIYLLVGVYHFLFFAVHRESGYNGFAGVFSFFMSLYYFSRTRGIYHIIPDTLTVVRLEFFTVFLIIPLLMAFTELLCRFRLSLISKVYGGCMLFLAVTQAVFPHPYGSDALIFVQITGILGMLWIFVYNIAIPFAGEVKKGRGIKAAIWNTYPGNMLVATGMLAVTVIVDMVDAMFIHYSIGFTRYSMVVFSLSLAAMLARLYAKSHRDLAAASGLAPASAAESFDSADPDSAAKQGWEEIFREKSLTDRETEVARCMLEGLSNREIADRIFRSKATVDYHITNIYRKFDIDDKTSGRAAFMALFIKPQNQAVSALDSG